jgi:ABC-type dipeptide/oligopeptide/nickel transport system permease subunit
LDKTDSSFEELLPRTAEWRRILNVLFSRKVVLLCSVILGLLIGVATFAPFVAPYDPYKQNLSRGLQQPSKEHLFGTDALGRDVLSRIIFGSRVSLQVGIISVGVAAVAGMILGMLAGFFGGWINTIIMRFIDALMAIPPIILALALAAALGGGLNNVMISLGISLAPTYARLMCGQVLSTKQTDYVLACRVLGAGNLRIMFRHILPNCFPPLFVLITLNMGYAILAEASLSFLGVGISPPGAAWGAMVNEGYRYLLSNPILSIMPGLCIMLVVLSFNIAGDGLRDALDPRLRGVL